MAMVTPNICTFVRTVKGRFIPLDKRVPYFAKDSLIEISNRVKLYYGGISNTADLPSGRQILEHLNLWEQKFSRDPPEWEYLQVILVSFHSNP